MIAETEEVIDIEFCKTVNDVVDKCLVVSIDFHALKILDKLENAKWRNSFFFLSFCSNKKLIIIFVEINFWGKKMARVFFLNNCVCCKCY